MKTLCITAVTFLALVSLSTAEEATTLPSSAESPCASKFKEDEVRVNVSQACVKKFDIKPEDQPKTEEEYIKTFDDKCYSKCLLTDLGMIKDLKFDRDAIKADILAHVVDKDFQTKITAYTMKCLDETEKSAGKLTEDNLCKASAQLLYCCRKEEAKLPC